MGHYHSYEVEAKGLGTSVIDFTEEEWKVNNKKKPNPSQNNLANTSLRGNNDDTAKRHLHDYSLAFSEVYNKKDMNTNRTNNSIRTNFHEQRLDESHIPTKIVRNEARDINRAVQFAEDIHYFALEAKNTVHIHGGPLLGFNIPPIHEQLFLERQRGNGMTFSDRYNRFLRDFEVTLDTFEHAQKRIKFHEISGNPKFKGDAKLLYSRAVEERSFQASRNKSDSRFEASERDHPLNASVYSAKKARNQFSLENSHERYMNQSQGVQSSSPYTRDQAKYHTFKAEDNHDGNSSQRNEESRLENQRYLSQANESQRSPQNPFYDQNLSLGQKSAEKGEDRQSTPRTSSNKKVQVGGSLNQSQIRQSQTKTPKTQSQSKKIGSSGHKSKRAEALDVTPQKNIPIVPSTSNSEIQNVRFQTPEKNLTLRTKTPPPRKSSPSPNTMKVDLKKGERKSVSPNQKGSGQKSDRIQYKSFWREAVRPKAKVVDKDKDKRVPFKHETAKIKEGFDFLSKALKPSKLNANEKYVPLEKKKPPEQLFDKSHDYELVYVRPSLQKNHSPESNNEQQHEQSQRNSEKKNHPDNNDQNSNNYDYDEKEEQEQEEYDNNYQENQEEEYYEEQGYNNGEYGGEMSYERNQRDGDPSLIEDEEMNDNFERVQRGKNNNHRNYDNNAEYVETSIDISSYLNNQKMHKSNQGMHSQNREEMYYDNNQQEEQQPEYYDREYSLSSSRNNPGRNEGYQQQQQMRYAPQIRSKYNQEIYEENQEFEDQNYLHDILDHVRNLHDKMENSFSDITRDHSRIAEEDEDRGEEQKQSQFKKHKQEKYIRNEDQNEQVQNFPGSSKLKVTSKKLRPQGDR